MANTDKSASIAEGKYEILSVGEVGGMGEVFKVRHRLLDEVRAIKIMRERATLDPQLRQRFLHEARMVSRLRHPNLAQLFDLAFHEGGSVYMVLEWIDGFDLAKLLAAGGPPPVSETLEIAAQTLSCLDYLHDQRIVHRDISTDNLMVTRGPGGGVHVKLIDLGIAKDIDGESRLTSQGLFVGKLRYAAPEAIDPKIRPAAPDPRSDLYSFGVVLYELLTGESPFPGSTESELIAGHLLHAPRDFDETDVDGRVASELRAVVLRALEKNPDNRFQSAVEFSAALEAVRGAVRSVSGERQRLGKTMALAASSVEPFSRSRGLDSEQRELSRTLRVGSNEWGLGADGPVPGEEEPREEEELWFDDLRRAYLRRQTGGSSVAASVIKAVRSHPRVTLISAFAALLLIVVGFSGVLAAPKQVAESPPVSGMPEREASAGPADSVPQVPEPEAQANLEPAVASEAREAIGKEPLSTVEATVALVSDSAELTSEVMRRLSAEVKVVQRDFLAQALAGDGSGHLPRLVVQLNARLGTTSVEAYDTTLSSCEAAATAHVLAVPGAQSLYSRTVRRSAPRCGDAAALAGRQLAQELVLRTVALLKEQE